MIAFDYLPISLQLASIMSSRTLCIEMLSMWNNREHWLNKNSPPIFIQNIWDGEKVRETQNWWNP